MRNRLTLSLALSLACVSLISAQTPGAITSPAAGSVLSGPSVTFTWRAGAGGVVRYWLELGSAAGANDLFSHPGQTTALSQTVTLPVDGRRIYARLYSVTDSNQWFLADTSYTASGSSAVIAIPVTGATKVGWTQPAQTVAQVVAGVSTVYVDGTGQKVTPTCVVAGTATTCVAPLPALTSGVHKLSLTYRVSATGAESEKSNEISVTTVTTLTPTGFGLRP